MNSSTLYLFPTSAEAEGFAVRCPDVRVAVVGVGMAESAAEAAQLLAEHRPARVVLAGVAGACDEQLQVGEVVEVEYDSVAGLPAAYAKEYGCRRVTSLRGVRAMCVNRTGDSLRYGLPEGVVPVVEQMEGAAVAAVCQKFGVEFSHIRAISNRVSDERSAWRVGEALEALWQVLGEIAHKK